MDAVSASRLFWNLKHHAGSGASQRKNGVVLHVTNSFPAAEVGTKPTRAHTVSACDSGLFWFIIFPGMRSSVLHHVLGSKGGETRRMAINIPLKHKRV